MIALSSASTTSARDQSIGSCAPRRAGSRWPPLKHRRKRADDQERHQRREKRRQQFEGGNPVDPHHRGRRVTDHAAGAARIGSRHDGGEKPDPDLPTVVVPRHDPANDCGCNIVQEDRQREYQAEKR
jgi:hypothetical protein